jgi:hypothetical protein
MVNYNATEGRLIIIPKEKTDRYSLREILESLPCRSLSISLQSGSGQVTDLDAINDFPAIQEVDFSRLPITDLGCIQKLSSLRSLTVAFGSLSRVDLDFCAGTLEKLHICYLRSLKDLSTLPFMPRLKYLELRCVHGFLPPDFRNFPNLTKLDISQSDWESLDRLSHLRKLRWINIWGLKLKTADWRPLLELPDLLNINGMAKVFKASGKNELGKMRPELGMDGHFKEDPEDPPRRSIDEMMEEAAKRIRELKYTKGQGWS